MKKVLLMAGIVGTVLAIGLVLGGCPKPDDPPATVKYTVTFAGGESTAGTVPPAQTVDAGTKIKLPGQGSMTAPTGKTFNGWSIGKEGDEYTVNADVTATAQWTTPRAPPPPNPLIGVWISHDTNANKAHYKFNANLTYETTTGTNFVIQGTYEITDAGSRLRLTPTGGGAQPSIAFKITKSLLETTDNAGILSKFTKNPEAGGGFNGTQSGNLLVGMWENIADDGDLLAFNGDMEYFWWTGPENRDGRIWWEAVGTYTYDSAAKELVLKKVYQDPNAIGRSYTVDSPITGQIELVELDGTKTKFQKRDNL